MTKKLWQASKNQKKNSNLFKFENYISKKFNKKFNNDFQKILDWSIKNSSDFWDSFWDFTRIDGIKGSKKIKRSKVFYKNLFLPGSKLNFANNLLPKNDKKKAATFISENGFREERSWQKLNQNSNKLVQFLKDKKINQKDRVAAYIPNKIESIISFLACAKNGIIWSSCSPDFGVQGVVDRFKQIEPTILITSDYYFYNGKKINILEKVDNILSQIPSIKKTTLALVEILLDFETLTS